MSFFEILRDKTFSKGIVAGTIDGTLARTKGSDFSYASISPGNLTFGQEGEKPEWFIAPWWCKHNIFDAKKTVENGVYKYEDAEKKLHVNPVTGEFYMELDSSVYYGRVPRQNGAWPNMLLEQNYFDKPLPVKDLKSLTFYIEYTLECLEDYMEGRAEKDKHSAQLLWTVSINNRNKKSPGFRDYQWFALQLFDKRWDIIPEFKSQDVGKEDSTYKYIYIPSSAAYSNEGAKLGVKKTVKYNALPEILNAFKEAKSLGYLKGCDFEDMAFGTTNFGMEMTGIYNLGARVHKWSITAEV